MTSTDDQLGPVFEHVRITPACAPSLAFELAVTRLTQIQGLGLTLRGKSSAVIILAILLVLALIFGVGSVLEGLAWGFLIVVALLVAAAFYGYKKLVR